MKQFVIKYRLIDFWNIYAKNSPLSTLLRVISEHINFEL